MDILIGTKNQLKINVERAGLGAFLL